MVMLIRMVSLLVASSVMVGCSFLPPHDTHSANDDTASTSLSSDKNNANTDLDGTKPKYQPFEASTLFSLMVAEIAGQRQQYAISLANYLDQAHKTQDPAVAERTTRIAQYLGSNKYAIEAATIWTKTAPNDALAHQTLAQELLKSGDALTALSHMEAEFDLTGDSQFDYLALSSQNLEHADKLTLLMQLERLTKLHSDYAPLWMAQGSVLYQLEDYPFALTCFENALAIKRNYTSAALNKARTLHKLEQDEDALELLNKLHVDLPQHKGVGILRARVLIDLKRFPEARAAFQQLSQQYNSDNSIKLSLALLHMELSEFDEAIAILSALTLNNTMADNAYFYLARAAELQEDERRAINNYNQVQGGPQLLAALVRVSNLLLDMEGLESAIAYIKQQRDEFPHYASELAQLEIELLIKHDDYEAAYQVADMALSEDPDNTNLLYSRGLIAEKLGNLDQLETDLRKIIRINPQDAEALKFYRHICVTGFFS